MNKKILTILSGALLIVVSAFLSFWANAVTALIPLLIGLIFLPVLSLVVLRQYSLPAALWLWVGISGICILLAPSVSTGILFAFAWLSVGMILRVATDMTIDLFPILLYGGSIYLALVLIAVAFAVKDAYGVFDFQGVFSSLENAVSSLLMQMRDLYQQYLPAEDFEKIYAPLFEQYLGATETFAYRIITFVLALFGAVYFSALKVGQYVCQYFHQKIAASPLIFYGVPREIAICSILLYVISIFISDTYFFAFQIAMTMTGFLFVPAGVGLVDTLIHKWSPSTRSVFKILLLALAFWGHFSGFGIVYTVLMVGGLYISLFRRIVFRKTKGGKKDE